MGKGGSDWTKFATAFYRQEKAKNPDYKFKNALKDAAKAYKGGSSDKTQAGGMDLSSKGEQLGGMDLSSKGEQLGGMDLSSKGEQLGGKRRQKKSKKKQSKKRRSQKRKSRRSHKK